MAELLPSPSDLIFYRTEDGQTRIELHLAEVQYEVSSWLYSKQEAEKEALSDDTEPENCLGVEK